MLCLVALYLIGIAATMKAPEYLRKLLFFEGTSGICYCDKLTSVHFIETYFDPSAVTVFNRIFDFHGTTH